MVTTSKANSDNHMCKPTDQGGGGGEEVETIT